jgi:hypothetical protein
MKPRIRWQSPGCFAAPYLWRVEYGFFVSHFVAWPDALEFALALRFGRKPLED